MASLLLTAMVLLWNPGCLREFAPYWRVEKLRVLAIEADPVYVETFRTATLSAVVDVPSGADITYAWEWCPFRTSADTEYACPVTKEELLATLTQQAVGAGQDVPDGIEGLVPDFDLGTQQQAQFFNTFPEEAILGICQSLQQFVEQQAELSQELGSLLPSTDCSAGYEISVRLIVEAGDERLVSAKRLALSTGEAEGNSNPILQSIEIRPATDAQRNRVASRLDWVDATRPAAEQWTAISPDEPLPIVAGADFEFRVLADPASSELWQPPTPVGAEMAPPRTNESLQFSWFISAGVLDEPDGLYSPGFNTLEDAAITPFRLEFFNDTDDADGDGLANASDDCPAIPQREGLDGCEVKLWAVVRDGRLGTDSIERSVVVVDRIPQAREE